MARYEVLSRKAYLIPVGEGQDGGPRLFPKGAKVDLSNDLIPGSNLKPLDAAARAAVDRRAKAKGAGKPDELAAARARIAELEAQAAKAGPKTMTRERRED